MRPVSFRRHAWLPFQHARPLLTPSPGRRFASITAQLPPSKSELQDEESDNAQLDVFGLYRRAHNSMMAMKVRRHMNYRMRLNAQRKKRIKSSPDVREQAFYTTLRNGQPDQIMALMTDNRNRAFIQRMPDSLFVSAFLLLTPEHFVEPYKKILARVHNHALKVKGYYSFKPLIKDYLADLFSIIQIRKNGDNRVGLAEHTLLLRWAASVGDLSIALSAWNSMIGQNVKPDVECFNLLLAASLWDQVHFGKERYRLHVTRYYMTKRRKHPYRRKPGYKGFGVRGNSVRIPVQIIVDRMTKLKISVNVATYTNLLLAYARVGYTGGIKNVLKSVWGIDVDILADETKVHPPVRHLPPSSPLYPSKTLLWMIAHIFGICSDLPSALQTVHFVSQQYNIKIPAEVWLELFERSYVLTKKQFNKLKLIKPPPVGQVPYNAVQQIYDMMEPAPTHSRMHVYRKLARLAHKQLIFRRFSEALDTAYKFFCETRRRRQRALLYLEKCLGVRLRIDPLNTPINPDKIKDAFRQAETWQALREYELLRLEVMQQRLQLERTVALGVGTGHWREFWGNETCWPRQLLPEFIAEWKDFLPECFYVKVPYSGEIIEFHGRTTHLHQNIRPHHYEPVRRSRSGEPLGADDGLDQLEPIDDYLWSHIRVRLGPVANEQPFAGFFERNWARMDAPGENFLWVAEEQMPSLAKPRERKLTRTLPESFVEKMESEEGSVDARLLIEREMRDGTFWVEMTPIGRWY